MKSSKATIEALFAGAVAKTMTPLSSIVKAVVTAPFAVVVALQVYTNNAQHTSFYLMVLTNRVPGNAGDEK